MSDAPKKKRKKSKSFEDAEAAIELKDIKKHFGEVRAVDGLSFRVPKGCVFGLIGPNGAGKTTTFSMLAGYLSPTSGDIYMLDHSPNAVSALKGRVGVLPQDALLPQAEYVGEYLLYLARLQGMEASKAEKVCKERLEEVDGADWWKKRCGELSHGMSKRVGIAQAFLGEPEVVMLDEPTAGLDPKIAYEVREIIRRRKGQCTLVISSHNLSELQAICDRAAILDRGHLVEEGSMAQLTASSEEIQVLLAKGPIPLDAIRAIEGVTQAAFNKPDRQMTISIDRKAAKAEEMIRRILVVLLEKEARISGLSKGKSLEKRVIELTE